MEELPQSFVFFVISNRLTYEGELYIERRAPNSRLPRRSYSL